jgi:hypothetical protein
MKLAPERVRTVPAAPCDGLSEEITGGAPGVEAGSVVGEVLCDRCVARWEWVLGAAVAGGAAVAPVVPLDEGVRWLTASATRLMAANRTRAATAPTAIISWRSREPDGNGVTRGSSGGGGAG